MFLIFALLMLLNYATDKDKFLFAYRIDVFGMPINILDGLIAVGMVLAPVALNKRQYPSESTHPALKWVVGSLVLASISGAVMAFLTGADLRETALMARNVLSLAAAVVIGYAAVSTLRTAKRAGYVLLISSFASACTALLFMRESAGTLSTGVGGTFNSLRTTNIGGDLGAVFAGFVAFSWASGLQYFPRGLALPTFLIAALGTFALPHRSGYLVGALTLMFALLWLPVARVGRRVGTSLLLGSALVVALFIGGAVYSQLSGKNFQEYVMTRVLSFLPNSEIRKENRPWETRLPGTVLELQMWVTSPVFGHGFGSQAAMKKEDAAAGVAFRHNVWTAALAEGGLPLFVGYLLPCVLCLVVGWRLVRAQSDHATVMIGAIAAMHGLICLIYCTTTMYLNQQRPAIPLGLICGLLLRVRQIQLAVAEEYAGYIDLEDRAFEPVEEYA
jgi:hypothetical protein